MQSQCASALAIPRQPIYHFLVMRFAKVVIALLCIICVLTLCIAPYVDLPVTILESLQVVLLLLFSLATAELSLFTLFNTPFVLRANVLIERASHICVVFPPIETNCVLQC